MARAKDAAVGQPEEPRPASAPPATPSPPVAKADDLEAIRSAVVDAAGVSAGLWLSYLFVLFYLLIAAGAVTHRDLFLDNPIKLPFLNVELPLEGFAWLGPALFLIVHGYVLLHFVLLSSKVRIFDEQLRGQIRDAEVQEQRRRELPINIFIQFLAGPHEVRHGLIGFLLLLIAWITLMFGPVALLVFFELQFLPYHDLSITMWQRSAVVIDLVLLWLLWPSIVRRETAKRGWRSIGWGTGSVLVCSSLVSVVLVFVIATRTPEWLEMKLWWFPLRQTLVARPIDPLDLIFRRPTSLLSNRLVLPGFDAIDRAKFDTEAKIAAAPEMASLRGRHLEAAVLIDSVLRKVDFTGANLLFANLSKANLTGATLTAALLEGAHLSGADLSEANLNVANLSEANLSDATLTGADLTGAVLSGADLRGAKGLTQAQLDQACGEYVALPPGLKLDKPCPEKLVEQWLIRRTTP